MPDNVLVDGRGGCHQDGEANPVAAAGPARLLPGGSDAAGKTGQHRCIQSAYVNPQLQGIGGNHSLYLPSSQAPLDIPALPGQISAPVGGHPDAPIIGIHIFQGIPDVSGNQLGPDPGTGKDYCFNPGLQQPGGQPLGFLNHPPPDALHGIDQGRIVEHKMPLSRGRAIIIDQQGRLFDYGLGKLQGVAYGSRAADKHRP
ncbi:hypothetical protein ES703_18440 [subsurface metagenome]